MRRPLLVALPLLLAACGKAADEREVREEPRSERTKPTGPPRVTVDHILVGVKSARFPGRWSAEKAKGVAHDLLDRLRKGGDWDAAKRDFSDDPPPGGPYSLANHGVRPQGDETARGGMVKGFGDVAFSLDVGEIGITDHGPDSPFGYHVIRRTK
jgi:hypothetical protein